ncbi:variable large family protein (plasmid) [Borreliella burgdorferi]|uniref:variable large family protein n=1 Tax=Borreliella burgdorferi TaxID=139 RepID=UPI001C38AFD8|nr:variable large family protein [Borreliella burgdorferi]QXG44784.1 variable large family protein [Borreliella burgdorferi]
MHKAVEDTAKAGTGGNDLIANVAAGGDGAAGNGAGANKGSVTGIAKGMKAIVDAAKKAGVEFKPDDVNGDANNAAGRLFANGNNADAEGAAEKAGEAVSAVSGDQILKAIVDAAGSTAGKGADTATNAVEAAIGADAGAAEGAAFGNNNMKKKNQIAAAIVLRGLAKDGKFANTNAAGNANTKVKAAKKASGWIKEMHKAVEDTAKAGTGSSDLIANVAGGAGNGAGANKDSVTGIAKGMKAIVDAAKKAGVELKADDVAVAADANNAAGKLFANGNNAGGDADAEGAAEKAGEAVSAVSGDQILKAIVDAAKKAGVELKAADVDGDADNAAGKLFANGNAGNANDAQGAAEKAGEAVSAVSGDQILKAIVDAAGSTEGKGAGTATNAVEAAIGGDGDGAAGVAFGDNNMKKKNQIAAAIVLRGLAKDGKFANTNANAGNANTKVKAAKKASGWIKEMHKAVEDTAKAGAGSSDLIANVAAGGNGNDGAGKKADVGSVTGIAKGMKAIVDAAKKAGVELKPDDAAVANDANDANNAAGRLFANGGNAGDNAADAQGAAEKAGEAVSAVSGDQILKAIVDAAGSTEGKSAGDATNAVEAAIGDGNGAGVAFGDNNMKKKNQIAAAIVLRGLAKDGKFANTNNAAANGAKVVAAVKSASGWIKEMHKAVEDTAKAGAGGSESIANVAAGGGGNGDGAGTGANKDSVTGIAKGMKAIVDAAKKAGVELKADDAAVAADDNDAGRLFANGNNAGGDAAAQGAAEKAGEAVSAVSGDQILKAIVDAAGTTEGKRAGDATNAVEAAIGADAAGNAAAFGAAMQKKNQIAAAIVLRGLAKDGKFANANAGDGTKVKAAVKTSEWIKEMHKAVEDTAKAGDGGSESIANVAAGGAGNDGAGTGANKDSVTGIAKGMKAIVDAAKKAGVELKAADAAVAANGDAGKLFASGNNAHAGAANEAQGAAEKAGEAVSAVSGDQILKAIVDAAGTTEGKGAGQATNAVEAAIGDGNGAGVAFGDNMKKKNQIAAAIVLRGLAKGGKFANTNDGNTKVKAAVKTSEWIKEMHKAVEDTAKAGDGGSESIANVAAGGADAAGNGAGKKADVDSVTGIAKGMKAIVDAAKKAGVELKAADADDAANNDAGKLFASGGNAHAGNNAGDAQGAAEKAGEAVSAVSGDQILKAIVDAAESTEGKSANTAKNAVEAAIGGGGDAEGVAFGNNNMKKNQIAAAIVLRGLAKGGKFANANANANGKVVAAVKTSEWIKEMHKAVEDTAKAGAGGNDLIANVAVGGGNGNGNGAGADKGSVTGIAKGMKAIVDAAKKAGVEFKPDDVNGDANNAAGRLFANGNNAVNDAQGAAEKAGEAVSAVSGDQILKAIVDAAGSTAGKGAGDATNAVEAAIGADAGAAEGAAFGNNNMKKKNQIAAAIVLRGLAKDGKFANTNAAGNANTKVKAAKKASGWIKEMHKAVEDTAKAGTGSSDLIANVAGGAGNGAGANKDSVTGIAKGMKAIVDAAKKAGVELKADDVAVAADANNAAGKLFANGNNAGGDADAEGAAEKAGEAVSAVSGDQILKAIVDAAKKAGVELKAADVDGDADNAAGKLFANGAAVANDAQGAAEKAGEAVSAVSGDQILKAIVDAAGSTEGKGAGTATNAVEAAIGGDGDGAAGVAFGDNNMKKKNQIAAAIVLRGLAKDGKFANTNANAGNANTKVKAAKKASGWIKEMHKAVEDTAKAGAGSSDLIANVAAGGNGNDGAGKKADVGSVTGIAKGMKAIVDAAKKAGVELKPDDAAVANDANDANNAAGRLFANGGNAGDNAADAQGAAEKAGEAVSAVSGDQILKAIVDAAGSTEGKSAGDATNAVEAAIGDGNGAGVAFGDNNMKKKNQIAAAIVLRGLAKDGKFANTNNAAANGAKVVAAVKSASGWIKEMHKAVEDTAKAGAGGSESIANVAAGGGGNGDGAGANKDSVTGIAKGMKAIVDAAKKAGVELKADDAAVAADDNDAGRLFANGNNAGGDAAAQGAAEKAGEAVSAVSGDQILKAIVDAAGTTEGKRANDAKNAVEAAIGADAAGNAAAFGAAMQKKNQIAAAIVLRGLAKDGKFANANAGDGTKVKAAVKTSEWIKEMHKAVEDTAKAGDGGSESIANVAAGGAGNDGAGTGANKDSVTGIAKGMKAIVDAAKKAGVELKAADAAVAANGDAGKLFASGNNAHAGAAAEGAAEKAGEAVSAVSGDQILKAIVDAAGTTEGKGANTAKNAVEAAIGDAGAEGGNAEGVAFGDNMKKKNQIAAAIVLRGLAKGGKFANTNDGNTKVKAAVKTSEWIKEMHKAVEDTAKAGDGGSESIANVAAGGADAAGNGAGKKADVDSVTGIAKGMKAIVDAAKKAGVELKAADADDAANNDAGKLFASGGNAHAGNNAGDAQGAAEKAGEAVSAVSGDQILKAIVDAAESTEGKSANTAKNAVEAAIGGGGDAEGVAFGNNNMKKNQIAAAIVLRGLAKGGKFANANANANGKVVAAVKTSEWIKEMHKAVEDTAKAGAGGNDLIANVAVGGGNGNGNGAGADKGSVTGIAKGMKAIVDAAKKAGVEFKPDDVNGDANNAAGRLFANGNNAVNDAQGAAEKAGEAVSAVSGDQILKAIVDAAESTEGKSANTAKNAVEAAIGGAGDAAAFGNNMKKNQIAAAIVLRGLAKGGKFANANAADGKVKAAVKTSEWIKEMHKAVEDTAKAGDGSNDELIANVAVGGGGNGGNGAGADKGSVTGIAKGMKAIVDAAESTAGKGAGTAKNAVEAAIGGGAADAGAAAAFAADNMKKNQIAAAIVLRGLAKGGKFANTNNDANGKVVAAVKHMHRATLRIL